MGTGRVMEESEVQMAGGGNRGWDTERENAVRGIEGRSRGKRGKECSGDRSSRRGAKR